MNNYCGFVSVRYYVPKIVIGLKRFKQMQIDYIDKNYNEHRGYIIKKYRTLLGSKLTVGEIKHKLINIRPGICKNIDE